MDAVWAGWITAMDAAQHAYAAVRVPFHGDPTSEIDRQDERYSDPETSRDAAKGLRANNL